MLSFQRTRCSGWKLLNIRIRARRSSQSSKMSFNSSSAADSSQRIHTNAWENLEFWWKGDGVGSEFLFFLIINQSTTVSLVEEEVLDYTQKVGTRQSCFSRFHIEAAGASSSSLGVRCVRAAQSYAAVVEHLCWRSIMREPLSEGGSDVCISLYFVFVLNRKHISTRWTVPLPYRRMTRPLRQKRCKNNRTQNHANCMCLGIPRSAQSTSWIRFWFQGGQ